MGMVRSADCVEDTRYHNHGNTLLNLYTIVNSPSLVLGEINKYIIYKQ